MWGLRGISALLVNNSVLYDGSFLDAFYVYADTFYGGSEVIGFPNAGGPGARQYINFGLDQMTEDLESATLLKSLNLPKTMADLELDDSLVFTVSVFSQDNGEWNDYWLINCLMDIQSFHLE